VTEPAPVDDARLAKLGLAATVMLGNPGRHTPLELRWAQQVLDLATALVEARRQLDELTEHPG
jgi:hypothetical protein